MSKAYVVKENDAALESWDDPERGHVSWRTLFSRGRYPSEAMCGGVATLEPLAPVKLHRHAPAEIYFILEGEGIVSIDGVETKVGPNDGVFIPSNALHGVMNSGSVPLRLFYAFAVDDFDDIEYVFD
jgi:mannose-6-phosphate isomerase-like protein (cupin superfamily)